MQGEFNVNPIQAAVIRELYRHSSARFSELNTHDLPNDHFSYHLRQLTKAGLLEKDNEGRYHLTVTGKTRAFMMLPNEDRIIAQGFIAVLVVLARESATGMEVLMQERDLEPYKGTLQALGGKVAYSDEAAETARKVIQNQAGLQCEVAFRGLVHFRDELEGAVVQDKFFLVFRATEAHGRLKERGDTGRNLWMTPGQVRDSPKAIPGVTDVIGFALSDGGPGFSEQKFIVDSY